jgi:phosphohistidine phosphatase
MNSTREVQLWLLRHAHAGDPMKWSGPDDIRPLSDKGRLQAERVGRLLAGSNMRPDAVLSSPKLRALETARLAASELGMSVRVVDELGGPLNLAAVDALLRTAGDPQRPLLVGHDPDFSALAAELAGVADLPVRKATIVRIDATRPLEPGSGILRWLVPPDLLSSDGRGTED